MINIETYLDSLPYDIEEIDVSRQDISYLDVTKFKNLKILNCSYNKLTSLLLNKKLELLCCSNNKLTSLQLNENLKTLHCSNNELTSLQLNENLQILDCYHNKLTSLQSNANLKDLNCYNNHLTSLYFNKDIETIIFSNNPICEIINSDDKQIINKKIKILNRFRYLYYCLKFKKRFRDLLWIKIREPKIREKYSHDYLVANLHEDTDLDEFLEKW